MLLLESRVLQPDGNPYDDQWYPVSDAHLIPLDRYAQHVIALLAARLELPAEAVALRNAVFADDDDAVLILADLLDDLDWPHAHWLRSTPLLNTTPTFGWSDVEAGMTPELFRCLPGGDRIGGLKIYRTAIEALQAMIATVFLERDANG